MCLSLVGGMLFGVSGLGYGICNPLLIRGLRANPPPEPEGKAPSNVD